MDRVILHSDMNGFYASCECLYHPEYEGMPLAVGGDPENRHGIILAKNQIAKTAGVKTGEALWEAQRKCPELVIVKPNYSLYQRFSRKAREIYYSYSSQVENFGLDESWIDCTKSIKLFGSGESIAEEIRQRIKDELGLTVSIGVSWNKIFSKFGSDYKKPDAVTCITKDNYREIVWPQSVGSLLYVGRATERKLLKYGIDTVGRLAQTPVSFLQDKLGKMGYILWTFANGWDVSEVKELDQAHMGNARIIKSVGNSITTPRDLTELWEIKLVLHMLTESVAARLRETGLYCKTAAIHIRTKDLKSYTRKKKLQAPTDITKEVIEAAFFLLEKHYHFETPIRSIGVRAADLIEKSVPQQVSIFEDTQKRDKQAKLDKTMDALKKRFGNNCVRPAATIGDNMSKLDPKKDNVVHPVGYF